MSLVVFEVASLNPNKITMARMISKVLIGSAAFKPPICPSKTSYKYTGAVLGVYARITTAPNSLTARAQVSKHPVMIPLRARGNVTCLKTWKLEAPKLLAVFSIVGLTDPNASCALLIKKGALTKAIATTIPEAESTNLMPNDAKTPPIGEAGARTESSAKPAALCGIKIGRSMMESRKRFPWKSYLANI
jgi:hypothetical protein